MRETQLSGRTSSARAVDTNAVDPSTIRTAASVTGADGQAAKDHLPLNRARCLTEPRTIARRAAFLNRCCSVPWTASCKPISRARESRRGGTVDERSTMQQRSRLFAYGLALLVTFAIAGAASADPAPVGPVQPGALPGGVNVAQSGDSGLAGGSTF